MSFEQTTILVALLILVVLLVRDRHPPAMLFSGVAFVFMLFDFVSIDEVLAQFTNKGLVTVVILLLLSIVLDRSRLLETVADRLVRGSYRAALFKLYVATAFYSAFLNNTAVVASLLGPLKQARAQGASRLLLPMCYAASLGGILTLVGTSTNLLVNSFLIGQELPALHLFDLLPVGLAITALCGLVLLVACPLLLRDTGAGEERPADYLLEAVVQPGSRLVGRTVDANGLRHLGQLFLTEIIRGDHLIAPVEPDEVLEAGDILVFAGDVTRLDLLASFDGLRTGGHQAGLPLENLVEVVVAAESTLVHRTVKEVDFRSQFDAAVIAVRRGARRLAGTISSIELEVGDTLVLVVGSDFEKRNNLSRNFVIVSRRAVAKFTDPRKGFIALGGFVGVILLSAFGVVDFLKGMLVLLIAFLAFGYARPNDLRRNMPFGLIFIIASSLVISDVMLSSGTAQLLARGLLHAGAQYGDFAALAAILVVTWILTELMSNNAAAALAFPIALGLAEQLGAEPMPFVMAVLYGASCSFLTPYGYQTNLMVMSPGRYTLGDYVRVGWPITLTFLLTALAGIPLAFPFH